MTIKTNSPTCHRKRMPLCGGKPDPVSRTPVRYLDDKGLCFALLRDDKQGCVALLDDKSR
ncbi:MAG: hypothetical protein LBL41_03390 [Bifidobacteriaceae bacterium]|nr:hypothetical protein [Bifidobacteriaceae bacterium]